MAWVACVALSIVTNVFVKEHPRQVMHMRKAMYRPPVATRSWSKQEGSSLEPLETVTCLYFNFTILTSQGC